MKITPVLITVNKAICRIIRITKTHRVVAAVMLNPRHILRRNQCCHPQYLVHNTEIHHRRLVQPPTDSPVPAIKRNICGTGMKRALVLSKIPVGLPGEGIPDNGCQRRIRKQNTGNGTRGQKKTGKHPRTGNAGRLFPAARRFRYRNQFFSVIHSERIYSVHPPVSLSFPGQQSTVTPARISVNESDEYCRQITEATQLPR